MEALPHARDRYKFGRRPANETQTPALRSRHWEAAEDGPPRDLTSKNSAVPSRRVLPSPPHST